MKDYQAQLEKLFVECGTATFFVEDVDERPLDRSLIEQHLSTQLFQAVSENGS